MAIQTKNSLLAVIAEVTEGTPVAPSAGTDFLPLEDDFSMAPSVDTLENAEIKASLAPGKPITGLENPESSFSLYLKGSGVEGQAPAYKQLLKAGIGTETVSVERDTVGGSTVSDLEVDAGEGAEFFRGRGVLVKDGTNGYSLRPVHSVSTDTLTLGFDLVGAPASGVDLGSSINYLPLNDSSNQTVSIWNYIGNGGAVQMLSGGRPTEISWSFAAGELINSAYSIAGIKYHFNPVEITATSNKLDFTDDGGTFAANVTAKFYQDPHDLADAVQSAMNAASAETYTVSYSDSSGTYTIVTATSVVFSLLWKTGVSGSDNTDEHIGTAMGYSDAADDTGALTYTSDTALSKAAGFSPSFDAADPLAAKNQELLIGENDDITCVPASTVDITLGLSKADILSICAESGRSGSVYNAREVSVSVTALLEQHDADRFRRLRENSVTRMMYAFGPKSGGNWVPGKSGLFYLPTMTVSSVTVGDDDGLATLELEMTGYADDSGNGEFYLNLL